MFFTYVLRSEVDGKLYIGFTRNVQDRLSRHNKGDVISTRRRRPLKLIFYEAYVSKKDALRREGYFKTNPGKRALRIILRETLCVVGALQS